MKKLTKNEWIAVAIGVVIVALFFIVPQYATKSSPAAQPAQQQTAMNSQVQITDEVVGTGATATIGSTVAVQYIGSFTNGKVFDSSIPRGAPLTFKVGDAGLIKGFTAGVLGMKVGGKRKVVIPPELGYGSTAYGPIPANSTLVFELQLVSVK